MGDHPVSVFDAAQRFHACRTQLTHMGETLERVTNKSHPGVADLCQQFAVLRTITNELAHKFKLNEGETTSKVEQLKKRDLQMIRHLEVLIGDFREILDEARQEVEAA